jgi:hypothetical protein
MNHGFGQPTPSSASRTTNTGSRETNLPPESRARRAQHDATATPPVRDEPAQAQPVTARRKSQSHPVLSLPQRTGEPQVPLPGPKTPTYLHGQNPYGQLLETVHHLRQGLHDVAAQTPSQASHGPKSKYDFDLRFVLREQGAEADEHVIRASGIWPGDHVICTEVDLPLGSVEGRPRTSGSFKFETRPKPAEPERVVSMPHVESKPLPPRQPPAELERVISTPQSESKPLPPRQPLKSPSVQQAKNFFEGKALQDRTAAHLPRPMSSVNSGVAVKQPPQAQQSVVQFSGKPMQALESAKTRRPEREHPEFPLLASYLPRETTKHVDPSQLTNPPARPERRRRSNTRRTSEETVRRRSRRKSATAAEFDEAEALEQPTRPQPRRRPSSGRDVRTSPEGENPSASKRPRRQRSQSAPLADEDYLVDHMGHTSRRKVARSSTVMVNSFGEHVKAQNKVKEAAASGLSHDGTGADRDPPHRSRPRGYSQSGNSRVQQRYHNVEPRYEPEHEEETEPETDYQDSEQEARYEDEPEPQYSDESDTQSPPSHSYTEPIAILQDRIDELERRLLELSTSPISSPRYDQDSDTPTERTATTGSADTESETEESEQSPVEYGQKRPSTLPLYGESSGPQTVPYRVNDRGAYGSRGTQPPIERVPSRQTPLPPVRRNNAPQDISLPSHIDSRGGYGRRTTQDFGYPGARIKPQGTSKSYKPPEDPGGWVKRSCGHFSPLGSLEPRERASQRPCQQCQQYMRGPPPAPAQPAKIRPTKTHRAKSQPTMIQPTMIQPAMVQPAMIQPSMIQPTKVQRAWRRPVTESSASHSPISIHLENYVESNTRRRRRSQSECIPAAKGGRRAPLPRPSQPPKLQRARRRHAATESCASSSTISSILDEYIESRPRRRRHHSECVPAEKCGDTFANDLGNIIDSIIEEHASSLQEVIKNIKHSQPNLAELRKVSEDLVQRCQKVGKRTRRCRSSCGNPCTHQTACQPLQPVCQIVCQPQMCE